MEITFTRFARALRRANIRVSTAETLDGFSVVNRVGIEDRDFLKDALSLTLAKSFPEKQTFDDTFERFFDQLAFRSPPKQAMLRSFDQKRLPPEVGGRLGEELTAGVNQLLQGSNDRLVETVQRAASELHIEEIASLREKRMFALGIGQEAGIPKIDTYLDEDPDTSTAPLLRYVRQYLRNEINNYVERQYHLHVDPTSKRALLEQALKSNLNHLPPEYYVEVRKVVENLARQLIRSYRRRAKRAQRGALEYRRTLRQNMAYDGAFFELYWKRTRRELGTIYVICDVSNSVASIARFLLLFLYELVDVLPRVRAFAFSSRLGEITDVFENKGTDEAIEEALFDWGKGNTDYGRALSDFRDLCGRELNRQATVVVLGDARSNYYNLNVGSFSEVARHVKHVFWLNPETRSQWREGDSVMSKFAPFCTRVFLCNQLRHIERFADQLVSVIR